MPSNRTLFFGIIGLAVVVLISMVLAYLYVPALGPQPTTIQVVVAPSIQDWAEQAAESFNATNRTTQVEIIVANELIPISQFRSTNAQIPAAWLAEATFVVDLARDEGLIFGEVRSVAGTSLAWGGYDDKLAQIEADYGPLSWDSLHAKATDDVLKLVIASPENTAEGLAALMSATAANLDTTSISGNDVGAADQWLIDTLGDRQALTPPTPAQSFAGVQGRTLGDLGLLSLASWRSARLDQTTGFTVTPAQPDVLLDYPLAIWSDAQTPPENQQAAAAFRDFLLSSAQQDALAAFYLDKAVTATNGVQADGAAAKRLFDWAVRELR